MDTLESILKQFIEPDEFTIKKEVGENLLSKNSNLNRMVREGEQSIERKEQARLEKMRQFFEAPDRQKLEKKFRDNPLSLDDDESDRLNTYRQPQNYLNGDMLINKGKFDNNESEQQSQPANDDMMQEIITQIDEMMGKAKNNPEVAKQLLEVRQLLMQMNGADNASGQEPVEKMGKRVLKTGMKILKAKINTEMKNRDLIAKYGVSSRCELKKFLKDVDEELLIRHSAEMQEKYPDHLITKNGQIYEGEEGSPVFKGEPTELGTIEEIPHLNIAKDGSIFLYPDGSWSKSRIN